MKAVWWLNLHGDVCDSPGMWDQDTLLSLIPEDAPTLRGPSVPSTLVGEVGVIVVAGRFHHQAADAEYVRQQIVTHEPGLVVVTSDEEGLFPWRELLGLGAHLLVMTPRDVTLPDGVSPAEVTFIGEGVPLRTMLALELRPLVEDPGFDWSFAGQVTHERRTRLVEAIKESGINGGIVYATAGFTQGMTADEYTQVLRQSKVVICPSGPATADSFRTYEAIEAGCAPLADMHSPVNDQRWWDHAYGGGSMMATYTDPARVPDYVKDVLEHWPLDANRPSAWWLRAKRDVRRRMMKALGTGTGSITVVIPTSPIESHPDMSIIQETIASVRSRLPASEVIIVADGVRAEQEHLRHRYELYQRRLLDWAHRTDDVLVIRSQSHLHQANAFKLALEVVETPTVLFVEHDAPLQGDVPFDGLLKMIERGDADVIRLCHESRILPDYEDLMLGEVVGYDHAKYVKTMQWSQRPHLASTSYYRDVMQTYFGRDSSTMIEDVMHGVVKNQVQADPLAWYRHRILIYAEPDEHGSIQRSYHLDGRGSDEKYEMVFEYDGDEVPRGAPWPTSRRGT